MAETLEALLGPGTARLLKNAGYYSAASLADASDEEILEIVGIGPATLQVIRSELADQEKGSPVAETKPSKLMTLPNLGRRRIRYILFRIKRGTTDTMDRDLRMHASAIKAHFDKELRRESMSWAGFTFVWDISPSNPYKIIRRDVYVWAKEGGSFEGRPPGMDRAQWAKHVLATLLQNNQSALVPFEPTAFTQQV